MVEFLLATLVLLLLALLLSSRLFELIAFVWASYSGLLEPTKSPGLRRAGRVIAIGGPLLLVLSVVLFGLALATEVHAFYAVAAPLFLITLFGMISLGVGMSLWKACVATSTTEATKPDDKD
ncbi:hypothetical protein NA78x_002514 [Anatilimnocola sp. NA78]|uniref:hypothetical protein n=1 Tax=Anatilimnocola sp. NA78 TaxID=3415683 RepID=UPI003CE4B4C8